MNGFKQATSLLLANRDVLDSGANTLLLKETLDEPEIRALAAELRHPLKADAI
jgi:ATP-dependent Zn protease